MNTEVKTQVTETEIDLDEFLSVGGPDNIITPTETKPSLFSKEVVDLSFLDENGKKEENVLEEVLNDITPQETTDDSPEKTPGRPKVDKSGLVDTFNKLIEKGVVIPFEDEKPIEEYTVEDFIELVEANYEENKRKVKEETPKEFFDSLPDELKIAARYVSEGGSDIKGLFRVLSEVQESRELDPYQEKDQETIVRNYLRATQFGTEDEIQEEIESWSDMNKLEEKALKFKPKLDKMKEQIVEQTLEENRIRREQQQKAAETYIDNIYSTLKDGQLNGIKLNKKVQSQLYEGLVKPSYPSISGRPTNLLGHLLEKYQYIEPRHDLIAEALWLLSDPDGYKQEQRALGKIESTKETVRTLKTEEQRKDNSTNIEREETKTPRIPRPSKNFFKR